MVTMKTEFFEFTVDSCLTPNKISCKLFTPVVKANVKAVFQIAHGMAEHKERYDAFCDLLAQNGYAVYINDHLGHGKSVQNDDELGFFGETGGWKCLVEDCYTITQRARSEFPDKPVIFFGHSMGSFIARAYTALHDDKLAGAIYCGTSGANPAASIAISLANAIARSKGPMYRSDFINTIAFGSYNKKIKPPRTDFDWLTRDDKIVDKYIADKHCGFLFTACGYRDLFSVLKFASSKSWYTSLRSSLPVLLISGECDPVGEYGKGVKQVCADLKKTGHTDVSIKLYHDDRHEILNELDRETVMNDIIQWADSKVAAAEKVGA